MNAAPTRRVSRSGRTRRTLRGLQAIAFLTVAASLFLAWQESRPFSQKLLSIAQRTSQFEAMERRPARFYELESRFARRARLESCDQDRNDIIAAGADFSTIQRLNAACLVIAERNLSIAPASSNDWMVAATLSHLLGDDTGAMADLRRSLETGPTEEWIAERRAVMLFNLEDQLDPQLRTQIDAQLQLLLRTEVGIQSIAQIYLTNTSFRDRIVDVAETMEPRFQEKFLNFVKFWAPKLQPAPEVSPSG